MGGGGGGCLCGMCVWGVCVCVGGGGVGGWVFVWDVCVGCVCGWTDEG